MRSRSNTEVQNIERKFELNELFFSTTDYKGVIIHGNQVFVRISGYSEEELIGSAHSIIRHPDMPRCVFQLLWDTIGAGKTIAAYVKNLASDGCYYWVLAVVAPCPNGYLSIRLKPSSPLLDVVKGLYEQLLAIEQAAVAEGKDRKQAIQASTAALVQALAGLGFPDYESFMVHALTTELESRHQQLGGHGYNDDHHYHFYSGIGESLGTCAHLEEELHDVFSQLVEFRKINQSIMEETGHILATADVINTLSMNAKISANLLGGSSATLQVIATALGGVSSEVQAITDRFIEQAEEASEMLKELGFDIAVAKIHIELARQFLREILEERQGEMCPATQQSLSIVLKEAAARAEQVFRRLEDTGRSLTLLNNQVEQLSRNNKRLLFVQFAGKKESVIYGNASSFAVVFQQVREQIASTMASCDTLAQSVSVVRHRLNKLLTRRDSVQRKFGELRVNLTDKIHRVAGC